MLLGDDDIGAFGFKRLVKKGWKIGRWANPVTAGATLAAKGVSAAKRRRAGKKGSLRGPYPELEGIAGDEDIADHEEIGFLKKLVKAAGSGAKFASNFVPGPAGMALKVAGGALGPKAAPPPPKCTLTQKIKRVFGSKQNCT